jgi:Acetyltransferase (GNAT) domain
VSNIVCLSPEDPSWRAFAVEHATSPLQLPSWLDALTGAYGLRAQILALAHGDGSIVAGMPLVRSKLPWKRGWTSLPFTDTLEPVAKDASSREELLIAAARDTGPEVDVKPIVVRTHAPLPGWSSREVGTVQVLDLSDGLDGVLRGADAKTRRNLKRAQRAESGLSARRIGSRAEFLGANLDLIARSRRRLGAPTQPRRYWSRVWDMHERGEALTIGVYLGERLVANGVFMVGNDYAVFKYSASDADTMHLRVNYLAFATGLDEIATHHGVRSMDFGITDLHNASLRKYKANWGGEERPAHFSATDPSLLPDTLEPGALLTKTIQRAPVFVGRAIGSLAYPFVA